MMADGRKNNGGHKTNGGRKSKADEEKANVLMLRALKEIYKEDSSDKAKVEFIKKLLESQRGEIFVAEHVFGKSPDIVKNTTITIDEKDLTKEMIDQIKTDITGQY
jgi:hypothetical protein